MKKILIAAIIGFALLGTASQPAEAFFSSRHFFFKKFYFKKHFFKPPKTTIVREQRGALGNSRHSWVPKYIFAGTACSALLIWLEALRTSQAENRELTQREAWTIIGNCYVPIVGGHVMGSLAQPS